MKRHKKAIAVLLAVMLITLAPVKARAIVPEVTAFFAAGVGWPLVATVLIAGGIGTALYWNSLDDIEKSHIVHAVRTELNARGLTLYDQFNNVYLTDNYKNYVQMAYADDGHTYMSKGVSDAIYDVVNDMGYTAGVSYTDFRVTNTSLIPVGSTWEYPHISPTALSYMDLYLGVVNNNEQAYNQLRLYLRTLPDNCLVKLDANSSNLVVYWTLNPPAITANANPDRLQFRTTTFNRVYINANGEHNISTSDQYEVRQIMSITHPRSNLGYVDYNLDGIPSGEYGSVTKTNDGYDYPWLGGLQNVLSDFGDSITLSISNVIGDIKSWEGELSDASDLLLDDVPIDADTTIDATQAIAQTGTIAGALFDSFPWETDIDINGVANFRLPNWIANKFPFSVFNDLKDTIDNFKMQVGDEAPVYRYEVNITGFPVEMVIDMNMFNDYAHYIKVYLFIIGVTQIALKTIEWFL